MIGVGVFNVGGVTCFLSSSDTQQSNTIKREYETYSKMTYIYCKNTYSALCHRPSLRGPTATVQCQP